MIGQVVNHVEVVAHGDLCFIPYSFRTQKFIRF